LSRFARRPSAGGLATGLEETANGPLRGWPRRPCLTGWGGPGALGAASNPRSSEPNVPRAPAPVGCFGRSGEATSPEGAGTNGSKAANPGQPAWGTNPRSGGPGGFPAGGRIGRTPTPGFGAGSPTRTGQGGRAGSGTPSRSRARPRARVSKGGPRARSVPRPPRPRGTRNRLPDRGPEGPESNRRMNPRSVRGETGRGGLNHRRTRPRTGARNGGRNRESNADSSNNKGRTGGPGPSSPVPNVFANRAPSGNVDPGTRSSGASPFKTASDEFRAPRLDQTRNSIVAPPAGGRPRTRGPPAAGSSFIAAP